MEYDPNKIIDYVQDKIGSWAVSAIMYVAIFMGAIWAFHTTLGLYISIDEKISQMSDASYQVATTILFVAIVYTLMISLGNSWLNRRAMKYAHEVKEEALSDIDKKHNESMDELESVLGRAKALASKADARILLIDILNVDPKGWKPVKIPESSRYAHSIKPTELPQDFPLTGWRSVFPDKNK